MAAARAPEASSEGTFGNAPALPRRKPSAGKMAAGTQGTVGGASSSGGKQPTGKSQAKWKAQSAQLRAAMQAGKGGSGGAGGMGMPVASEPDQVSQLPRILRTTLSVSDGASAFRRFYKLSRSCPVPHAPTMGSACFLLGLCLLSRIMLRCLDAVLGALPALWSSLQ